MEKEGKFCMSHTVFWFLYVLQGLSVVGVLIGGSGTFVNTICVLMPNSIFASNFGHNRRHHVKYIIGLVVSVVLFLVLKSIIPDPYVIYP